MQPVIVLHYCTRYFELMFMKNSLKVVAYCSDSDGVRIPNARYPACVSEVNLASK